jgi:hypothetical protein
MTVTKDSINIPVNKLTMILGSIGVLVVGSAGGASGLSMLQRDQVVSDPVLTQRVNVLELQQREEKDHIAGIQKALEQIDTNMWLVCQSLKIECKKD